MSQTWSEAISETRRQQMVANASMSQSRWSRRLAGRMPSNAATMSRWTGKSSTVGRPTSEDKQRVQAENSPGPKMGGLRPATLCRFCMADQMAVMTDRGVPFPG